MLVVGCWLILIILTTVIVIQLSYANSIHVLRLYLNYMVTPKTINKVNSYQKSDKWCYLSCIFWRLLYSYIIIHMYYFFMYITSFFVAAYLDVHPT